MDEQQTPPALTRREREEFLRQHGWDETLPEQERQAIENRWSDTDIEMARSLGF